MQNLTLRTKAGSHLLSSSKCTTSTTRPCYCRSVSSSPYGRTHIWKRRLPVLPNPTIPKYPQTIIRSDGTSFVQWTTSPKSLVRLTRDTTNNPIWNTGMWVSDVRGGVEEEVGSAGRMGRFNRKFGSGVGNVMVESTVATTKTTTTTTTSSRHEEGVGEGEAKREEGETGTKSEVKTTTKVKEDMLDLTGMGMGMGMDMSMGMGGSLDDVMWYEDMAKMTGGEPSAPVKVKKEKEEKKEEKKVEKKDKKGKK